MSQPKERRRRGKRSTSKIESASPFLSGKHHNKNTNNNNRNDGKHPNNPSSYNANSTSSNNRNTGGGGAAPKLSYKPHNTLLVQFTEQTPTWYDCGRNTPGRDDTIFTVAEKNDSTSNNAATPKNSRETILKYRQLADEIYSHEVSLSRNNATSSSSSMGDEKDEKWVENTMKRGTLKDRIAAMSVVVGMDCIHKLYALDMLLDLAGCGVGTSGNDMTSIPNSRVGQMASEALSDLFANTLLSKDRKLISLEGRPLHLYEGSNKRTLSPRVLLLWRYEEMIKQRYASYLSRYLGRTLAGEDEPSKKNALATASFLLKEVPEGEELLLTMIVNKVGDPARKIASAAGHQLRQILEEHPVMVNVVAREVQQLAHRPHLSPRALYNCIIFLNQLQLSRDNTETDDTSTSKRPTKVSLPASLINTYFHLFEMTVRRDEAAKKKGSKQKKPNEDSSGMKSRLLSALLTGVNRAHPYLPKKDAAMEEHIDALYRISHTAPPAAATQALMLLFQLAVGSGDGADDNVGKDEISAATRKDRFYRALYSKIGGGDMFTGRQLTLFFNLLYKAMKYDTSGERICAFSKRLLHTALHQSSSIICGALFLLSEIVRCHPELKMEVQSAVSEVLFDPTKREPRAAFSGKVTLSKSLWEVSLLAHHFHPSVAKFTANSNGGIVYAGDPLKDFALAPFLDKFAFRNPKSLDKLSKQMKRGESIAERKSGLSGGVKSLMALPMNDPSHLESQNVAEEEEFFHQFFAERAKRDELKGIVRGSGANKDKDGSDLEDEALHGAEADEQDVDFESDSEEEAFVHQLAEKLMESSGNGKVNFDDEDPDMEGWSDFDDDDDDDDEVGEEDDDENDAKDEQGIVDDEYSVSNNGNDNDGDAFMDAVSSDDDEGEGAFGGMEQNGSDSDDFSEDDALGAAFGNDSDDESDEEPTRGRKKGNKTEAKLSSVFADADEYEKILEEEISKNSKREHENEDDGDNDDHDDIVASSRKKKKKRKNK